MGCSQSTPGHVMAHSNHGAVPNGHAPQFHPNGIVQVQGWNQQQQQSPPTIITPDQQRQNDKVGQEVLERYLALEEEIAIAEKNSPALVLQNKRQQIASLDEKIETQKMLVEQLENDTQKEKRDVENIDEPETKRVFMDQGSWEDKQSKEMQEYLDALNQEEIAKTELSNLVSQRVNLQEEIEDLEEVSKSLDTLYEEQENLLDEIFGGAYGSDAENRLENALDQHEQMRLRIVEANFKWRQAQLMVDYAHKQLWHAVKKWKEIPDVDSNDLESRYIIASEARNNLVAASQNIQGAQRYLSNVQFPYCAPPEVDTLNKATAYIFTDMQTSDRHAHALECYTVTAKRCGALLHWIHQVVTETISRDLSDINAKVKEASMALRQERVKLIKEKVKQVLGKDVDIAVTDINTDVKVDLNLNELAKTEGIDPNTLTLTAAQLEALSAMNDDEDLAPPPSQEEVFGEQLEKLNKELIEDQERLENQMAENKTRVAQNLESKLAERRRRRARKRLEEKEKEAFTAKK